MFKFLTAETAAIVLKNGTLRWSTPRTFNDPFDVQFDLRIEVDRSEVRRLALQKMWDDHYGPDPQPPGNFHGELIRLFRDRFPRFSKEEFEKKYAGAVDESLKRGLAGLPRLQIETRDHMRDSKILCLTSDPNHVLMWTHYAQQHTGVVLCFRNVEGLDSPWQEAKPVEYVNDMPLLADSELLSDIMSGRASFDIRSIIHRLVYTKSVAFSYEKEQRIYSGAGRNPGAEFEDIQFHPMELETIIFGLRTAPEHRSQILALIQSRYPHVVVRQANLQADRFGMEIV